MLRGVPQISSSAPPGSGKNWDAGSLLTRQARTGPLVVLSSRLNDVARETKNVRSFWSHDT